MTINILKTESFLPLGKAIRKPVAEKPYIPEKVRPGVFKDQQGRLYTDIATPGMPQVPKPTPLPTLPAVSVTERAKGAEQAAFETWAARVCPSGDVESVQQQWEDSSDYADFLEAQENPAAAPVTALGDGWIDCGDDMPDLQVGEYLLRNKGCKEAPPYKPKTLRLRENISSTSQRLSFQYKVIA